MVTEKPSYHNTYRNTAIIDNYYSANIIFGHFQYPSLVMHHMIKFEVYFNYTPVFDYGIETHHRIKYTSNIFVEDN